MVDMVDIQMILILMEALVVAVAATATVIFLLAAVAAGMAAVQIFNILVNTQVAVEVLLIMEAIKLIQVVQTIIVQDLLLQDT
jgi:hypothetical protein